MLPQILPFSFGDLSVNSGDTVSVSCTVGKGDLPIKFSWFFQLKPITDDDSVIISKISKRGTALTLDPVTDKHVGVYTCLAQNSAGTNNFSSVLRVNGIYLNFEISYLKSF